MCVAPVFDRPQPTGAVEDLPLIDERAMADWCGELDRADVMDLLGRVPGECAKCLTGIREASTKGDLPGVKRMAHRLKGMASNLGATRLAHMARGIELASADLADAAVRTAALEQTVAATLEAIRFRA